jgi:hypothetical protein
VCGVGGGVCVVLCGKKDQETEKRKSHSFSQSAYIFCGIQYSICDRKLQMMIMMMMPPPRRVVLIDVDTVAGSDFFG